MVIVKLNAGTANERAVEIVDEKGTWQSGNYHIFASSFLNEIDANKPEPHNINSPDFLGEISVDKEKAIWEYFDNKLEPEEQKQVADFIIDYRAPDGVY